MKAKILASYTAEQVAKWMTQGQNGDYELTQVKTGKRLDPQAFLEETVSKQFLFAAIQRKELSGFLRDPTGDEYDHLVFELGTADKALAQALSETITKELANPNYGYTKNQGGGRFQDVVIKGEKETLYKLEATKDGEFHLHVMMFRYAVDYENKKVCPQDSFKNKYVSDAALLRLNEALTLKGLPIVEGIGTGIASTIATASPQTKTEVSQVLQGQKTLDEVMTARDVSEIPITVLDSALDSGEKELARLMEAAKRKQDELAKLRQARDIHVQLAQTTFQLSQANAKIEEQNQALKEADQRLQELTNEIGALRAQAFSNSETIQELTAKIEGLENDYSNQAEELAEAKASTKAEATKAAQFEAQAEALAQALKEATEGRLNAEQRATLAESQAQAERAEKREALAVSEKLAETIKTREIQITAANKETAEQEKRAEAAEQRAEQAERVIQAMNSRLEKIAVMVEKIAETAEKKLEPVKAKLTKTGQAMITAVQKQTAELREAFTQAPDVSVMLASGEATDPEEALRKAIQRARETREKEKLEREEAQKNTPSGRKPT